MLVDEMVVMKVKSRVAQLEDEKVVNWVVQKDCNWVNHLDDLAVDELGFPREIEWAVCLVQKMESKMVAMLDQ